MTEEMHARPLLTTLLLPLPSSRRKPGSIRPVKRGTRRSSDSIQGIPAFAGMTVRGSGMRIEGRDDGRDACKAVAHHIAAPCSVIPAKAGIHQAGDTWQSPPV